MYHFGRIPWTTIAISGHGLAPEGVKISKSRGGGTLEPFEIMQRYSADAIRYWAASTRLGHDSVISDDKVAVGNRLTTKLWNVARFALGFLEGYRPLQACPDLTPTDRWVLSRLQRTIRRATEAFRNYDYVSVKEEIESFFWNIVADNYLEMVKIRLYELSDDALDKESARYALYNVLGAIIKILAPIMPHITEEIFLSYFAAHDEVASIHVSRWPTMDESLISSSSELVGEALVALATEVRRFKTTHRIRMGAPLTRLQVASSSHDLLTGLRRSELDIRSVTRAKEILFSDASSSDGEATQPINNLWVRIEW